MTTQHMTRDEQIKAVLSAPVPICPSCEHGMDPHGLNPGDICGVSGGCPRLLTPSAIHHLLIRQKAEAWDEGHHAGHEDARAVHPTYPDPTPNPYRAA